MGIGIIIQFVGWKITEYFTTNQMCVIWWSYISIPRRISFDFGLAEQATAALQEIKQLANLQEKQSYRHNKYKIPPIFPHMERQRK